MSSGSEACDVLGGEPNAASASAILLLIGLLKHSFLVYFEATTTSTLSTKKYGPLHYGTGVREQPCSGKVQHASTLHACTEITHRSHQTHGRSRVRWLRGSFFNLSYNYTLYYL